MIGVDIQGKYRILARLGEGGMGEVYLAEHVHLARKEALKIIRGDLANSPQFVSRFRREARAINRLHHPNIVSVYDFGQLPDERLYLAMEYADGQNLATTLSRQGRLPVPRALKILAQLADAIDHAHERGVVHRDLKPENLVLVEHRGQADHVKVLDFGLAKIISSDHLDSVASTDRGSAYGTPAYMSPEQLLGTGLDPRMDLYAFGCLAYEILTGAPPFTGRPMAVCDAHISREPTAPSAARPEAEIPRELDAIVLRCLAKQPADRYQTGREVVSSLRALAQYPHDKGDSGRRSLRKLAPLPARDGFEDELTTELGGPRGVGVAPTELAANPEMVRVQYLQTTRQAAEAVLDAGSTDVQVMILLAEFNDLASEIVGSETEIEELERQKTHTEQKAREREASLRFALGELRFEQDRMLKDLDATIDPLMTQRIRDLEAHLTEVLARRDEDLMAITDREVAIVAELARREERLLKTAAELERAAGAARLALGVEQPDVDTLLERARELRHHAISPE